MEDIDQLIFTIKNNKEIYRTETFLNISTTDINKNVFDEIIDSELLDVKDKIVNLNSDFLSFYRKIYFYNFNLRKDIFQKTLTHKNAFYNKIQKRTYPNMEDPEYFKNQAKIDDIHITVPLNVKKFNEQNYGSIINLNPELDTIWLSGPSKIILSYLNKIKKELEEKNNYISKNYYLITNSIRTLFNNEKLINYNGINQIKEKETDYYDSFSEENIDNEAQACLQVNNFNTCFNIINNLVHFVCTSKKKLCEYMRLYPHKVFIIQPENNIINPNVGMTRNTVLNFCFFCNLKKALFLDDTIYELYHKDVDIVQQENMYSFLNPQILASNERLVLSKWDFLMEYLFKNDKYNYNKQINHLRVPEKGDYLVEWKNIGYIGFCSGSFLDKSKWEQDFFNSNFIVDYDYIYRNKSEISLRLRKYINNNNTNIEKLQTCTDMLSKSFINPHRPNMILINCYELKNKNINYNCIHSIGEDIVFSKSIFTSNLEILHLNIAFMRPSDNRRPKTCSITNNDEVCVLNSDILDKTQIDKYNSTMFSYKFIDFYIFRGRIIFLQKDGIVGGSGVYGPVKTVVNNIYNYIIDNLESKKIPPECHSRYINNSYNIKTLYPFNINYTDIVSEINNKNIIKLFNNKISSIFNNDFIGLITEKYFDGNNISNLTLEQLLVKISNNDSLLKKYIETNINILNFSPFIGYEKDEFTNIINISKGTGMIKYVQDYEFLNFEQYRLFDIFYNNVKEIKYLVDIFYDSINLNLFKFNDYDLYNKNTINCIKKNDLMNIYLFGRQNEITSIIRYYILNLFAVNVKINKIIELIKNYSVTNKNNIINILFSFYQLNNNKTYNFKISKELNNIYELVINYFKNENVMIVDIINEILLKINIKTVKFVDIFYKSKYLKYKKKYIEYKKNELKL